MKEGWPESWGRYPKVEPGRVESLAWMDALPDIKHGQSILPYGMGRSYGDVCLNEGGTLLLTKLCDRLIAFDTTSGVIRCEAGLTIGDLHQITIPHGWFVPVTPGTKYVTLGGALANDVHGKNHHRVGTFGCHVIAFELLRSDGSRRTCSQSEHADWFAATIGGLGLTGLVTWVEIQLCPIASRLIEEESIKVGSLSQVVAVMGESDRDWDYTVSWIDVMASGANSGRGLVIRGNFRKVNDGTLLKRTSGARFSIPIEAPSWLLSRPTIKAFNVLWYNKQLAKLRSRSVDLESFFYPLDSIQRWNLLYGKRGMLQYQCVVPADGGVDVMLSILDALRIGRVASFLAVVKKFGAIPSPGMLSFPRPGLTLTLDMPNSGSRLFDALNQCDKIVHSVGGRIYAAKDARINGRMFRLMYPEIETFASYIDPNFSSSFWRRIHSDISV